MVPEQGSSKCSRWHPLPRRRERTHHYGRGWFRAAYKLLSEIPRFQGLEVFPKGIPRPDVFIANIQLR